MITGVEIPFTLALLYPVLNHLWWLYQIKPDIEKEIVHEPEEISGTEIYSKSSNYVWSLIYSSHKEPNKSIDKYRQFRCVEDEVSTYLTYYEHINSYNVLPHILKSYNVLLSDIPITTLPIRVTHYNYKNGIYYHSRYKLLSSDKHSLLKALQWRKRLPQFLTIPFVAGVSLAFCWLKYRPNDIPTYYPPFHPKRIKNYFK